MSAVNSAVATAGPAPRRRERLHGLLWLSWRQNRSLVWALLAFLLLLAGAIGWCVHGLDAAAGPQHLTASCAGSPPAASVNGLTVNAVPTAISATCRDFLNQQGDYVNFYEGVVQLALLLSPIVIGMFVGAPLLSREFERRTQLLAWAQSVSPGRWLAARLGSTAAVVLAAFAVAAGLSEWFWRQYVVESGADAYALQGKTYDTVGVVLVGYALFALALGVVVGLLLRSTLASALVTGVLTAASMVVMYLVRPHLYPPVSQVQVGQNAYDGFLAPANAWLVDSGVVLPGGARVSAAADCTSTTCQNSQTFYGVYQPASHFWPLQLIESGVLFVLAAALMAFAFARVRRSRR